MSEFYEFASGSPWLTFFLACALVGIAEGIGKLSIVKHVHQCDHEEEDE